MNKVYNDIEYNNIIEDILKNDKFKQIDNCRHHGITRMEHSLRVSYYSYILSKKLKLNYQAVARAGLLHDFFINEDLKGKKSKLSMFFHPYKSLENSEIFFNLNDIEKDIIITHMFPALPHKIPKYLESWLVNIVDTTVATYEFYYSYGRPYVYKLSNLGLFLFLFGK